MSKTRGRVLVIFIYSLCVCVRHTVVKVPGGLAATKVSLDHLCVFAEKQYKKR